MTSQYDAWKDEHDCEGSAIRAWLCRDSRCRRVYLGGAWRDQREACPWLAKALDSVVAENTKMREDNARLRSRVARLEWE